MPTPASPLEAACAKIRQDAKNYTLANLIGLSTAERIVWSDLALSAQAELESTLAAVDVALDACALSLGVVK